MTSAAHGRLFASGKPRAARQRRERHVDLFAAIEVAQRGHFLRDLVLAEDHRGPRLDLVGPLQALGSMLPE